MKKSLIELWLGLNNLKCINGDFWPTTYFIRELKNVKGIEREKTAETVAKYLWHQNVLYNKEKIKVSVGVFNKSVRE